MYLKAKTYKGLRVKITLFLNPELSLMYQVKENAPKSPPFSTPKSPKNVYTRYRYFIYQLYPHHTLANLFNKISHRIKVVFGTKKAVPNLHLDTAI